MATVSPSPRPFQSLYSPDFHKGIVPVTGSATVNLGLNHKNFTPVVSIEGVLAGLALGYVVSWEYGLALGTFIITVAKFNAGTWIAATVPVNVSFLVLADSSVKIA